MTQIRTKIKRASAILIGSLIIILLNVTYFSLKDFLLIYGSEDEFVFFTNVFLIVLIIIIQVQEIKQYHITEALNAANEEKTKFLANMSHELRTPLNSIIGFSELLIDADPQQNPDERKEFLQIINSSAQLLLQLINDILSISKIQSGSLQIEKKTFSLLEVIEQCKHLFQKSLAHRDFNVENRLQGEFNTVFADQRLLLQILINLLSNAIKFTPEGSPLGIILANNAEELIITVWDKGIGIDPVDFDRLFKPFSQLEEPITKKHQGTGLGLYICKNIVEMHGGRIWVESTKGEGARFSIAIPQPKRISQVNKNAEEFLDTMWKT